MINSDLLKFAELVPPHQGKTATSAEKVGTYRDVEGQIAGEVRVVRGWIGLGQKVSCYLGYHYQTLITFRRSKKESSPAVNLLQNQGRPLMLCVK